MNTVDSKISELKSLNIKEQNNSQDLLTKIDTLTKENNQLQKYNEDLKKEYDNQINQSFNELIQ